MTSRILVVLLGSGFVACGGGAPESASAPKVPAVEPSAEAADARGSGGFGGMPRTIAEAEETIARTRAELSARPLPPAQPGSKAEKESAPERKQDGDARPPVESRQNSEATCPCRALTSMRRAVGALCAMTGDADSRCAEARRTLEESIVRLRGCSCG